MNKQRLKSEIYSLESRIACLIAEGVSNRASKKSVMKAVKAEINKNKRLNDVERNSLWLFAVSFYRKCVAGASRETDLDKRKNKVYGVLRDSVKDLDHIKNNIADSVEHRFKHRELVRVLGSDDKFYYCTVHANPAEGHVAYQGKIYFKGNANYSEEEKEFISSHGLLSVEEVVLNDPWLCTRKNCKHRLIAISFLSAKTGDFSDKREIDEISYEEEQYRFYFERLKLLNLFKKKMGVVSESMENDIRRTRKLVKKWFRAWKNK